MLYTDGKHNSNIMQLLSIITKMASLISLSKNVDSFSLQNCWVFFVPTPTSLGLNELLMDGD